MFYFDGHQWIANKFKFTYQTTAYDDNPDAHPGAVVEPVVLTPEQELRLEEVRYQNDMTGEQLIDYVVDGIGEPPETRGEIDILIDLIPVENLTGEVTKVAPKWEPNTEMKKGRYVSNNDILYKVVQYIPPHLNIYPPGPGTEALFSVVLTSPTGEPSAWIQPGPLNGYSIGDRVTHNGKLWESQVNDNNWEPGAPGVYDNIWKEVL